MPGFSDGVRPGGLYDSREIKVLICYMLSGVPEPLSRDTVIEILTEGEMANLFEISAAIDDLTARGNLAETDGGLLTLTESGRTSAEQLYDLIPYTLRDRSQKAAMKLLARARNERDADVVITPLDVGYSVKCSIDKTDAPMMSFTLRVTDETIAKAVRERFLDDPTAFYRALIALSTGDFSDDDGKLVVEMG
ncbi:MAG: DUF4364 family protein [Clostridia bacterium]|nr:DUF4364 family protein [Clostridia bacterium]